MVKNLDRERRHSPIPLAWMSDAEAATHRRLEAALIVWASRAVMEARRIDDAHLYVLAREALEDARARWQEFTP